MYSLRELQVTLPLPLSEIQGPPPHASLQTSVHYSLRTTGSFMNESFMTDAKSAKSKGGIWKGHYEQFGQKHEMIFKSFKAKREGKLQGKGKDDY